MGPQATPVQSSAPPVDPSQPLTPLQVQQYRQSVGIKPGAQPAGSSDQWANFDKITSQKSNPDDGYFSGFISRMGSAISAGVGEAKQGLSDAWSQGDPKATSKNPVESGMKIASGAASVLSSPISAALSPAIDPVVKAAADKLSGFEWFQRAVNSHGDLIARGAQDVGDLANIAGTVAGAKGTIENVAGMFEPKADGAPPPPPGPGGGSSIPSATDMVNKARDFVTKLPPEVQKTLEETPDPEAAKAELQKYIDSGQKSLATGGKELSPYEVAGRDYLGTAMKTLDSKLNEYGQAKTNALSQFGDKPVDPGLVQGSIDKLDGLLKDRLGTQYNGGTPVPSGNGMSFDEHISQLNKVLEGKGELPSDETFSNANGRVSQLTGTSDKALIQKTYTLLNDMKENGTTAQKLDDTISVIRQDLDYQKNSRPTPSNTKSEGIVKGIVHDLSEQVKSMGGTTDESGKATNSYSDAMKGYSDAIKVKQDLETRLGGQIGGDYKNAASVLIRRMSPQDGGTRAALRALEEQTGVPVFQHAILAKFAMDVIGDPRVHSLIESVADAATETAASGPTSALRSIWHTIVNAISDPEGKAMRILDDRIGAQGTKVIYNVVKSKMAKSNKQTA